MFVALLAAILPFEVQTKEINACYDNFLFEKIVEDITIKGKNNVDIVSLRSNKLLLKSINNFFEVKDFNNDDNYLLADAILMLKINDGIVDYQICKNNDLYLLRYKKDLFSYAHIFNKHKKIFELKY